MYIDRVTPQLLSFLFFGNLSLSGVYKLEQPSRMTSKLLLLWVRKLRPREGKWLGLLHFPLLVRSRITKVLEAQILFPVMPRTRRPPHLLSLLSDLSLPHRHERSLRPLQFLPTTHLIHPTNTEPPHNSGSVSNGPPLTLVPSGTMAPRVATFGSARAHWASGGCTCLLLLLTVAILNTLQFFEHSVLLTGTSLYLYTSPVCFPSNGK